MTGCRSCGFEDQCPCMCQAPTARFLPSRVLVELDPAFMFLRDASLAFIPSALCRTAHGGCLPGYHRESDQRTTRTCWKCQGSTLFVSGATSWNIVCKWRQVGYSSQPWRDCVPLENQHGQPETKHESGRGLTGFSDYKP